MIARKFDKKQMAERRAMARRFSHNLKRLLDAGGMSQADLGRKLDPNHKNPSSLVYSYLQGKYFPPESSRERFAQALGVNELEFHTGDLQDFMEGDEVKSQKPKAKAQRRTGRRQKAADRVDEVDPADRADQADQVDDAYSHQFDALLTSLRKAYGDSDAPARALLLVRVGKMAGRIGL